MMATTDDSLLSTMSDAADALQCRVAAGRSQLSNAMLACNGKQALIDDTIACMTSHHSAPKFTVHVILPFNLWKLLYNWKLSYLCKLVSK